jgi:hypothetical protein
MIGSKSLVCFVGFNYECIFVGFLNLLQCFLGWTISPRACIEGVPFPANGTFDCLVLDRVVIDRMISSTRSASDLGARSGTMLRVDGLTDSADLERGYHLRCRSKDMVAHHDAACTNVLGRILCDIELEFQGLDFCCASFLGEAEIRCQIFSKNVGKVFKVKPKRDSVENHALLDLLNGVAHLLCNSTLPP